MSQARRAPLPCKRPWLYRARAPNRHQTQRAFKALLERRTARQLKRRLSPVALPAPRAGLRQTKRRLVRRAKPPMALRLAQAHPAPARRLEQPLTAPGLRQALTLLAPGLQQALTPLAPGRKRMPPHRL